MSMSLKAMASNAEIEGVKKTDIFRVDPRLITEEEGFNLRDYDDPEVQAHIQAFADSYKAGSFVPPLVVRVMDDGSIVPVEGHCRRRGALLAIEQGADLKFVDCVQFRGNDAERVEVMLRSAEGLRLNPLNMGLGFLRLTRMGHDVQDIATIMRGKVGPARIRQLLSLAEANHDVHALVRSGSVPADLAIEAVREHGEKAGEYLLKQVEKAKQIGKQVVTKSVVKGPVVPPKVVSAFVQSVKTVMTAIPEQTRAEIATLMTAEPDDLEGKQVMVDAALMVELLKAHEAMAEEQRKAEERLKAKEKAAASNDSQEEDAGA